MSVSADLGPAPRRTETATPVRLLAALGAVLACYGYLVGLWAADHHTSWWLLDWTRTWVARSLGLGEDFGPLGVMLLLASGGLALSPAAGRWPALLWRRYATVLLAVVVAAALLAVGVRVWTTPPGAHTSPSNFVCDAVLACTVLPDKALSVPLAWAAALDLAGIAALGLLGRLPAWARAATQVALVWVLVLACGGPLRQLGVVASFYPLVVVGQLVRAQRSGDLPTWAAVLLGWAAWGAVAVAEPRYSALARWWYPLATAYAGLLVAVTAVVAGPVAARLAGSVPCRWLAERAWPLALLQGAVGWPVLTVTSAVLPLDAAVVLALVATGVAADLAHRLLRLVAPVPEEVP